MEGGDQGGAETSPSRSAVSTGVIACLGWGSLIWDPRGLPVRGTWFEDGPFLPIEFARCSNDGRLTLVIVEGGSQVRSLWAPMSIDTVEAARDELTRREGVPKGNRAEHIGLWTTGDAAQSNPPSTARWARGLGIHAVVWTALPPCYRGKNGREDRAPSEEEAVAYLRELDHERRRDAERYIRLAPRQVDTPYRRRFELEFRWTPQD